MILILTLSENQLWFAELNFYYLSLQPNVTKITTKPSLLTKPVNLTNINLQKSIKPNILNKTKNKTYLSKPLKVNLSKQT